MMTPPHEKENFGPERHEKVKRPSAALTCKCGPTWSAFFIDGTRKTECSPACSWGVEKEGKIFLSRMVGRGRYKVSGQSPAEGISSEKYGPAMDRHPYPFTEQRCYLTKDPKQVTIGRQVNYRNKRGIYDPLDCSRQRGG